MSIARNAALLSANFVAAIMCISLNRETFKSFPFPAALTTLHYARHNFYLLVCCWSACNALSNVSLDRNSVGFYQLVKILVTPSLVAFDFVVYGRRTTLLQGVALVLACLGVGVASVDDVQVNAYGALIACSAVITAAAQKVLNMHVQQVGGLSALQVLSNALPAMTLLSLAYVPLLDRDLPHLATCDWATTSATAIFGLISALAHVLLGQVKTCSVIVVGALFYDAPPTPQDSAGMAGAALALLAITGFSLLRLPAIGAAAANDDVALRLLASEEGEGEDSEARLLSNASAFEAPTGVQEGSTK
ncbi:hypothetical protein EMIHUDRAFT_95207 [Emiliania huxleyi CCMP1516]|uniref:Sugar phosphate transporter domain-containing protein n=2 Tax=Emiliania huxleyi TaxID=2903 RepID=A0A0D3L1Z3_EMIH1|nr:hypothetical protein EMIHUDRAFT_119356 [Emiliania huxleyi CCMP1516]XP_005794457.1 hypothetical protein EMIHUDRAFT_95207 [Emiliania huxleyi CCMP1516]EOD15499.1 hypothetical protein EMIHUDRAFT_119356 [Emiliania huxleyi CCMP1516]EOD42028.1 hypothetical protein EMIHUDRAFT_95207 [Emiliania huxleyi CCMP1516]|eukprot:XP_005767928.1 hypothetical protein EMIHUDRAFT_119356 [Emiliania huxleyi CCMP1516]